MINLPKSIDQTTFSQKIIAGALLGAGLMGLWYLLPPIIVILSNLLLTGILLVPIVFLIYNYQIVWWTFKNLSWYLTKWIISVDKLGIMERYYEYLHTKVASLEQSRTKIGTTLKEVDRKIAERQASILNNKRVGTAALEKGQKLIAQTAGNALVIDERTLETILPRRAQLLQNYQYLGELQGAWTEGLKELRYTIDSKREEFETLKAMNEATGSAKEFLRGDSQEAKMYNESLRQLEEEVSRFTTQIESFEIEAKPILEGYKFEKELTNQEGLAKLESYKQTPNFLEVGNELQKVEA